MTRNDLNEKLQSLLVEFSRQAEGEECLDGPVAVMAYALGWTIGSVPSKHTLELIRTLEIEYTNGRQDALDKETPCATK